MHLFLIVINLKIYSLSNFQIYNTVLLTIVTKLYTVSPELIFLRAGSLYLLVTFTHFPHAPTPSSGNLFSVFMSLGFLDFIYK